MIYRALADFVVLVHMAFVLFAALGGVLVFKWRRVAWFHIPAALWGALIEFVGWVCPLTPLENWLRRRGGEAGYQTGFIERYLLPLIYPAPVSRSLHIALGLLVLAPISRSTRGSGAARPQPGSDDHRSFSTSEAHDV